MAQNYLLTKSKYIRGLQCDRALWLDVFRPSLARYSPEQMRRFDRGREFEYAFKETFPEGIDISAELKRNTNGKIDRRQLQELSKTLSVGTGTLEAPSNQREMVLLDLAKKLLGTEDIGVTDDLTQLGLSSLDAIKLSSLAEKKGMRLMVNDILNNK